MGSNIMFIDPGSKSAGYALYNKNGILLTSGTVKAHGEIQHRLSEIVNEIRKQT